MFAAHVSEERVYPLSQSMATSTPSTLNERIKEVCDARGWTEKEWCERAQVSPSALSKYRSRAENDVKASMQRTTLRLLADAAGVHELWLRRGEGPRDLETAPVLVDASALNGVTLRVRPGEAPQAVYGALARWPEIEERARALRPLHPAWVWDRIASIPLFLRVEPNAENVAALSDVVRWTEDHLIAASILAKRNDNSEH